MGKPRARDLGIPFDGTPGSWNAITDVPGVLVGHDTLISGQGTLEVGKGPIRTGVTAILPCGGRLEPVFAAWYALNGAGEITGTTWMEESGLLQSPIMLTNTFSVGEVATAVHTWGIQKRDQVIWPPVVAETYDGFLNDIRGLHVKQEHAWAALDRAASGPVYEGNVGGGTGMICHTFKGGIGTASRRLEAQYGEYTLGVLVQANHGGRRNLRIAGIPVGVELAEQLKKKNSTDEAFKNSSIIVVVATDCPLLPHQLKRLARRVPLGIGIVGGRGENYSGDIFLAFSTAPMAQKNELGIQQVDVYPNHKIDVLFNAVVQATEEAIVNALIAAETMEGINSYTVHALPHQPLQEILESHGRLIK
jgi:L-aminopeptidase/D-esterase-like protein